MPATMLESVAVETVVRESPTTLSSVLSRLNIAVYPQEKVAQYKNAMRRREIRNELRYGSTVIFCTLCLLLSGTVLVVSSFYIPANRTVALLSGIAVLILSCTFIFILQSWARRIFRRITWLKAEVPVSLLASHGTPLAQIDNALRIKHELPGAIFSIESLRDDPFLRVDYMGHHYYFGFWDEPEFEEQ